MPAWWTIARASAVSTGVGASVGSVLDSLLNPVSRGLQDRTNRTIGHVAPGVAMLLDAYARGAIDWPACLTGLQGHGIFGGDVVSDWHKNVWQSIVRMHSGWPDIGTLSILFHRDEGKEEYVRNGLKWHHFKDPVDQDAILFTPNPLPLQMLLDAINRGYVPREEAVRQLNALGFGGIDDQDKILDLGKFIPGPSDLIRFAVREVWDDDVVRRFGYDQEFPERFRLWMGKQGYDYHIGSVFPDLLDDASQIPWSQAYWRAHWTMPSPGQSYEMFHRLRDTNIAALQDDIPGVREFTLEDVERILKIQDYPPEIRKQLAAIAYRPLTRVDVRRMHRLGILDFNETISSYQDLGYNTRDAERMARFTAETNQKTRNRQDQVRLRTSIRCAYEVGILTRGEAAVALFPLGEETDESQRIFREAEGELKERYAERRPWIRVALSSVDLKIRCGEAQDSLKILRKAYGIGMIDAATLASRLAAVGIQPDRIARYVRQWTMQRGLGRRQATASQLQSWFRDGVLSADELERRLGNLDYSPADVSRIMRVMREDLRSRIAREEERLATDQRTRRNAQVTLLRSIRTERNRIIADLNRSATVAQIERFYRLYLVTADEAGNAMQARGVNEDDAARRLAAVDLARTDRRRNA